MKPAEPKPAAAAYLRRHLVMLMGLWTVLVASALFWGFHREDRHAREMAAIHARLSFERDLRSGISSSVPIVPLRAMARERKSALAAGLGLLWLIGLAGIGTGGRGLRRRVEERDRAAAELRRQQRELRTLLDALPGQAFFKRADGVYLAANKAFCDAVGCAMDQIAGRTDRDLFPPQVAEKHGADDRRLVESGCARLEEEQEVADAGGRQTISTRKVPLTDESGRVVGLIGLGFDVTENKRIEQERSAVQLQLQQAQRLESVGRLAAGIAHEINTPTQYIGDNARFLRDTFADLTKLLGEYEKLQRAAAHQPATAEQAARIAALAQSIEADYLAKEIPAAIAQSIEGVERVARIVRAMKAFSHPRSGEKQVVDLNRAIESTVAVARGEWQPVAEVVLDLDPSLPTVLCLAGEFNQVILNLLVNAAHAVAEVSEAGRKGRITVSTRCDGPWVEVRLHDTGRGIPENIRPHIFEPFFTTKPMGKGTGQGLALARWLIVERHGGTIHFETEIGQGTTFVVRLPITPMHAAGNLDV